MLKMDLHLHIFVRSLKPDRKCTTATLGIGTAYIYHSVGRLQVSACLPSEAKGCGIVSQTSFTSGPVTTATIPYIRGTSETIAHILQPHNIRVAHKLITTLRRLLTNVKEKDKPEDRQGAVYKIKCCDCQAYYIGETGRNLSTWLTKQKRATRNGDVNNHIAEHHLQTKHQIDRDSGTCITYSTDYYRFFIQFWTMEKKKSENEEKLSSMVGLFVILDNVPSSRSWSPENWRLMHNQSRSVQTHRSFNQLISNHLKDFILDDIQTINFLPSCLYHMVLSRSRSPKRLP